MRVVIDFDEPGAGSWSGRFTAAEGEGVHFDGRLQLLRLIEAVIDDAPDNSGTLTKDQQR